MAHNSEQASMKKKKKKKNDILHIQKHFLLFPSGLVFAQSKLTQVEREIYFLRAADAMALCVTLLVHFI